MCSGLMLSSASWEIRVGEGGAPAMAAVTLVSSFSAVSALTIPIWTVGAAQ